MTTLVVSLQPRRGVLAATDISEAAPAIVCTSMVEVVQPAIGGPSLDSRLTEMLEEQYAQTDYGLKVQAQQFWSFLATLQDVRRNAIDAKRRVGS